ncbi:Hypp611 [Branchiostoma lanceolatum]|uniref:Hypp611 protein n=1 Tax=Branchiostoma lanceolatum TaxID=7740 RepID=A0A8J9YQ90_BRALA|nr:Hypp611 [Branchiostoma lanceolatum]
MKVIVLIAVILLGSVVMVDSWRRRGSTGNNVIKKGETLLGNVEAAQDASAGLLAAESDTLLGLMNEIEKMEGTNRDLDGDTFEKKVATFQEAAADLEEEVNEAEEDAALGLVEEELEKLEEELEEVNYGPQQ